MCFFINYSRTARYGEQMEGKVISFSPSHSHCLFHSALALASKRMFSFEHTNMIDCRLAANHLCSFEFEEEEEKETKMEKVLFVFSLFSTLSPFEHIH